MGGQAEWYCVHISGANESGRICFSLTWYIPAIDVAI